MKLQKAHCYILGIILLVVVLIIIPIISSVWIKYPTNIKKLTGPWNMDMELSSFERVSEYRIIGNDFFVEDNNSISTPWVKTDTLLPDEGKWKLIRPATFVIDVPGNPFSGSYSMEYWKDDTSRPCRYYLILRNDSTELFLEKIFATPSPFERNW